MSDLGYQSKDFNFQIEDLDWARELEEAYDEYQWACESVIDGEEPDDFTTITGEPFCGCNTCYSREQISFLAPRIIKAYLEGKITLA